MADNREFINEWPPVSPPSPILGEPSQKKYKIDQSRVNLPLDLATPEELQLVCKEGDIDARSLVAQWWKKRVQRDKEVESSVPQDNNTNPKTLLNKILKLPSAKQFLELRIDHLQKNINKNRVEVAICYHLLGDTDKAWDHMQYYLSQTEPQLVSNETRWTGKLIEKQYHVLQRQRELMTIISEECIYSHGLPQSAKVERRDCSSLSVDEFFHRYAMSHTPLIITGLKTTTLSWNLDHIKKVIGERTAPLRRPVPDSVEWAQLESCGYTKVSEFIETIQRQEVDQKYLFDWSIPLYCPELLDELIIPRYFTDDFLQLTPPGSLYRESWPSLFIAPAGANSSLHVDTFGSNFWMALFEGRKRWLFFPPEDLPCLYPRYHLHSSDPVFDITLDEKGREEHPLVAMTHPRECILEPGEVLFVPAGSPHQVVNLEASLAISANFVNHSNINLVKEELGLSSLVDEQSKQLLSSLDKLDLTPTTAAGVAVERI